MMDTLDSIFEEAMRNRSAFVKEAECGERVCTKCNTAKHLSEFNYASRTRADVRNGIQRKKVQCRACDSLEAQAWRKAKLGERRQNEREFYYKKKYNVDEEAAKFLADARNRIGNCPICHTRANLILDHDHSTGAVRDLICNSCNSLLGYARESIDSLYNAIAYLKKHRGV